MITFQTIAAGEILGASWLVPPFRWTFDARALERTRAIALDAVCVRTKCEENPELTAANIEVLRPLTTSPAWRAKRRVPYRMMLDFAARSPAA